MVTVINGDGSDFCLNIGYGIGGGNHWQCTIVVISGDGHHRCDGDGGGGDVVAISRGVGD